MNSHLGPEMGGFSVANLGNRPAITCDLRLEAAHFRHQSASSRLIQRFLGDSGLVSGAAITLLNVGGGVLLMLNIAATVLHSYQTIALAQAKTPKEAFFSGYQAAVVVILGMTLLMLAIAFWSALSRQRAQRGMPDQPGAKKPA